MGAIIRTDTKDNVVKSICTACLDTNSCSAYRLTLDEMLGTFGLRVLIGFVMLSDSFHLCFRPFYKVTLMSVCQHSNYKASFSGRQWTNHRTEIKSRLRLDFLSSVFLRDLRCYRIKNLFAVPVCFILLHKCITLDRFSIYLSIYG